MGRKITVDSATLANKGLELIEAHFLFGVPYDADRSRDPADLGRALAGPLPRRRRARAPRLPRHALPISYALTYPERAATPVPPLDFTVGLTLEFEAPDVETFPMLRWLASGGEGRHGTVRVQRRERGRGRRVSRRSACRSSASPRSSRMRSRAPRAHPRAISTTSSRSTEHPRARRRETGGRMTWLVVAVGLLAAHLPARARALQRRAAVGQPPARLLRRLRARSSRASGATASSTDCG